MADRIQLEKKWNVVNSLKGNTLMDERLKLEGKWKVTKISGMSDEYLRISRDPHVQINVNGPKNAIGDYSFGPQSGEMDCEIKKNKKGELILTFTFEGVSGTDSVHGYGKVTLVDENTMKGEMRYHKVGSYNLTCIRVLA